jgi:hypothetical protein
MMTTDQQLELGFNGTQTRIYGRRRESRAARAQWWFAQMHAAVANAVVWPSNGQMAGEQGLFPDARREIQI